MAKYASKVVEQAKSWLGCNEYDGSHKQIIDVYNSQAKLPRSYPVKYSDAWCATFVSAVSVKLGYTDIMPTECGCPEMIKLYKKLEAWVEDDSVTPESGWIMFYNWDDNGVGDTTGDPEHVGIVEKVENGKITVIEGNYSNSVKRRVVDVNGRYIRGYGVPKYDKEATTKKTVNTIAKEVIAGKWGSGEERKKKLHHFIVSLYLERLRHAGGSPKIIGCMKELWSYLMNSFEDPQNIWRKVKKINNLDVYEETVELIFRDEKLKSIHNA